MGVSGMAGIGGERSVRFRAPGWRKRTFVHDADSRSYAPHNQTFDDVRPNPESRNLFV